MSSFQGFPALDANFTPAPNVYFDVVLREEDCVAKVVGFLIRDTLGWQDRITKARRVEAGLSLSDFMARGMARNSARKGIDLAVQRGYIVKTADETPRLPARYALRWEDEEAQREAIRRERLANSDPILDGSRGSKNDPVKFCPPRGSKNDPLPIYSDSGKKKKKEIPRVLTFNVGGDVSSVDSDEQTGPDFEVLEIPRSAGALSAPFGVFTGAFKTQAIAIAAELQDLGSEQRHRQLLEICDRHGLGDLVGKALQATRDRQARQGKRGLVEKPGAYYQSVLLKMLEDRQVFVPKVGEDDTDEVRRLVRESLRL